VSPYKNKQGEIMNKLVTIAGALALAATLQASEKPNILWLTSEDNNVTYIGCYGNEMAVTPNIDKLAREGFRYTHAYSSGAVCSASRSTWITGMLSSSTGLLAHRSEKAIPNVVTLYPRVLQKAGYYTVNSHKRDYNIENYDNSTWGVGGSKLDWNRLKQNQPFFQVINDMESHESRAMGTDHIHDSAQVKIPPYHPDVQGVRDNYAHYYDAITRMDSDIGRALADLEEAGLAENTIVIYNSDHGGPLPRGKRYMYNSGTHCPLIIRIPEKFKHLWPAEKPGMTVDRLVSFVDMPATWISLAGGNIPANYQGRVFLGPDADDEAEYHFSFRGRNDERIESTRSIRNKQFLYVKNYIPYVARGQHLQYQWMIPMQRVWEEYYKSGKADANQSRFFEVKPEHELYDTEKDSYCLNNLADNPEFKGVVKQMKKELGKHQKKIYDAAFLPESELDKLAADNNITVFEVLRNSKLYDIERYIAIADTALQNDPENIDQLIAFLSDSDGAVRYWGAVGLMMLGEDAASAELPLIESLKDSSDNVRLMAAWALIKINKNKQAYTTIEQMLSSNSYAMLAIVNVIDWMGADGKPLHDALGQITTMPKLAKQVQRYILEGQLPLRLREYKPKSKKSKKH
jgi:N-sulfoglucosamine sulfohydrolase